MIQERNGIKELGIFWSFQKDMNLPKFKNLMEDNDNSPRLTFNSESGGWDMIDSEAEIDGINDEMMKILNAKKSLFERLLFYFLEKRMKKNKKLLKENKYKNSLLTIREYFTNFSKSFKELTPIVEIADYYEKALEDAKATGQKSLIEKIENILEISRTEAHLIQMKLNKYVSEEQMIDFYEKTDRNKKLKLTWIKNFVKIIPEKIITLKKEIDERGLFDNYVILHFDPNGDATNLTEEEKEVKKDPILFGVMEKSRKLYYIADWVDDYCDLTLDKMFTELNEKVFTINNKNVKTYIDRHGEYEQKRVKL